MSRDNVKVFRQPISSNAAIMESGEDWSLIVISSLLPDDEQQHYEQYLRKQINEGVRRSRISFIKKGIDKPA